MGVLRRALARVAARVVRQRGGGEPPATPPRPSAGPVLPPAAPEAQPSNNCAPEVGWADLDTLRRRLAVERPTVVNHWATWCEGCVEEIGEVAALVAEGIDVIGVGWEPFAPMVPESELIAHVRRFAVDHDVSWPTWVFRGEPDALFAAFDIDPPLIPQTWLVKPGGRIVWRHVGLLEPRHVEVLLAAIRDAEGQM